VGACPGTYAGTTPALLLLCGISILALRQCCGGRNSGDAKKPSLGRVPYDTDPLTRDCSDNLATGSPFIKGPRSTVAVDES
jgi:hypothetical protein